MANSNKRTNKQRYYTYYLLIAIISISIFLLYLLKRKEIKPPVIEPPVIESETKKLYFVIDDVGHNLEQLENYLKLPVKITFAILPGLGFTKESEMMIKYAGQSYILHQPMEAIGGQEPGPGAIYLKDSEEEIIEKLNKNISQFDNLSGVNNHMGSLVTSDDRIMKIILTEFKKRNIYFLDSLTSSGSVVSKAAEELDMNYYKRSVFLDNSKEKEKIIGAVESGLSIADTNGYAVMIGHVWTNELAEIIMDIYPDLIDKGYTFEDISSLFKGKP